MTVDTNIGTESDKLGANGIGNGAMEVTAKQYFPDSQIEGDLYQITGWHAGDLGIGTIVTVLGLVCSWVGILIFCLGRNPSYPLTSSQLWSFGIVSLAAVLYIISRSSNRVVWDEKRKIVIKQCLFGPSDFSISQKDIAGLVFDCKRTVEGKHRSLTSAYEVFWNRLLIVTKKGRTAVLSEWAREAECYNIGRKGQSWSMVLGCEWYGGGQQRLPIIHINPDTEAADIEFVPYGTFTWLFRTQEGRYHILVVVLLLAALLSLPFVSKALRAG